MSQTYYGSIGFATPAALGADMALQDLSSSKNNSSHPRGRTVLITGDGSLQLTIQEIGTMIMHKTAPVILIINNRGYTVERAIHGAKQSYNDIAPYNYAHMLQLFGMPDAEARRRYHRCETRDEVRDVFARKDLERPDGVMVVEVMMDAFDAPWRMLKLIAGRGGEATVKEMEDAGFDLSGPVTK